MKLKRSFFNRDTNLVAKELLGKKIVRVLPACRQAGMMETRIEGIITETEAYHGFNDKASHASRKKTERNKIMFNKAGLVYVYLVYGMHWCLNFTTMPEGFPAAVLVRAVSLENKILNIKYKKQKLKNVKIHNTKYIIPNTKINGPGRVTKYLHIDKSLYGEDITTSKKIWIESVKSPRLYLGVLPQVQPLGFKIIASKRVGVDYAGKCADWKWNYKI